MRLNAPPRFAHQLARTRALLEAGMPLPFDLATWVLAQLEESTSADYRRLVRDEHLRAAGRLIGGTIRMQAMEIRRIGKQYTNLARTYSASFGVELRSATGRVWAAQLVGPLPGMRQLQSILRGSSVANAGSVCNRRC